MSEEYDYSTDEKELMARGARARDVSTGKVAKYSGEAEVVRFIDDGYRIYATWVSGGPVSPKPGQCIFVAEYKHCDLPALGDIFANALMTPNV